MAGSSLSFAALASISDSDELESDEAEDDDDEDSLDAEQDRRLFLAVEGRATATTAVAMSSVRARRVELPILIPAETGSVSNGTCAGQDEAESCA